MRVEAFTELNSGIYIHKHTHVLIVAVGKVRRVVFDVFGEHFEPLFAQLQVVDDVELVVVVIVGIDFTMLPLAHVLHE